MNIFVGNLPDSISAVELRRMFSRYGTVIDAAVAAGNGGGRVHANVVLLPNRGAQAAILELDLTRIGGRQISVRECARRGRPERRAARAAPWTGFERRRHERRDH